MKNKEQILIDINTIFRSVFKNDHLDIQPTTTASDIKNWDSLTHMVLIAQIEEHFGKEFSFNEVMDFQNVGDIVETLYNKLS